MKTSDFDFLAKLLYQESGLVITPDKTYLLESRLMPVARKWKLTSIEDLVSQMNTRRDPQLVDAVTDAMTTNESLFFRDMTPFDKLRDLVFPKLLEARAARRHIKIWSAACSSGQEPYSIAMLLAELAHKFNGWRIDILATDISKEMLAKARAGTYSQFEVQRGLPIQMLVKYFSQDGEKWVINDKIRRQIQYREFNLLKDPAPLGDFDIVMCRNVLIYFDQQTKSQVLNGIAKRLPDDGYLFLGGAETVIGLTDAFQPVKGERGVYQKP